MRPILIRLVCVASLSVPLVACGGGGNDVDPRVIPGGGVGDGAIDGEVNIHVIDADTDQPVGTATVGVAEIEAAVDDTGLMIVEDVKGPQTVAVKAQGYRSVVWVGVNGANITIPLTKLDQGTVDQATLSGSIAGWDQITVTGVRAAFVAYAQTDDLGDPANELQTPNDANVCFGNACAWSLVTRAGTLHVIAIVLDITDPNNTPTDPDDDEWTVIRWANRLITVEDGVNQSGIVLDLIEAGNLDAATVDMGTPPAALTERTAIVGIEIGDDEVIQIPYSLVVRGTATSMLVPKLSVFPGSTYRLSAVAGTSDGEDGAQSIVLRRGLSSPALAAGTWLTPPTGVTIDRAMAAWTAIPGALVHQAAWDDVNNDPILEVTVFDASTSVTIPTLVAVPATGALRGRVGGIAATLDPMNFSLDADEDKLEGIAAQPIAIP